VLVAPLAGLGIGLMQFVVINFYVSAEFFWIPACVFASISGIVYKFIENDPFMYLLLMCGVLIGIFIDGSPLAFERRRFLRLFTLFLFSGVGLFGIAYFSSITGFWYMGLVDGIQRSFIGGHIGTAIVGSSL
jgi:hypothetical protein